MHWPAWWWNNRSNKHATTHRIHTMVGVWESLGGAWKEKQLFNTALWAGSELERGFWLASGKRCVALHKIGSMSGECHPLALTA